MINIKRVILNNNFYLIFYIFFFNLIIQFKT